MNNNDAKPEGQVELLAPAGSPAVMRAALEAGANAVYFGLRKLNARRGAVNFRPEELAEAVALVHQFGAKAHLTLNIDLSQRDLGLALRTLALAEQAGVDAVLIRDAALLEVRPCFPRLQFHFSTQAGVSSSAGCRAAVALGLDRVVLAREMSAQEIAAASREGCATEAFVQGALCFSCSGRCLLSSWGGGRSGNRGACASPCRVAWRSEVPESPERPMSMHDLCLLEQLPQLLATGISSLKIEGRLKTADWVARAVTLYRQVLDGKLSSPEAAEQAEPLGACAGRRLCPGYFLGNRENLTGEAARPVSLSVTEKAACQDAGEADDEPDIPRLTVLLEDDKSLHCKVRYKHLKETLRIPEQRIANPRRAQRLGEMLDDIADQAPREAKPIVTCVEKVRRILLPRRWQSAIQSFYDTVLRQASKTDEGEVKASLPPEASAYLRPQSPCAANRLPLNGVPGALRLSRTEIETLRQNPEMATKKQVFLEVWPSELSFWQQTLPKLPAADYVLALPQIIYEEELDSAKALLELARKHSCRLEVNSWDTWQLAREAGWKSFVGGPGLAVLNANAARFLHEKGCQSVTVSPEIDKRQLEELTAVCPVPLNVLVFSRPPLMQTRAELPCGCRPEDTATLTDGRQIVLRPRREGTLTVLRPQEPMDWRRLVNPDIKVANMVVDLVASPDPCRELREIGQNYTTFNYGRRLR